MRARISVPQQWYLSAHRSLSPSHSLASISRTTKPAQPERTVAGLPGWACVLLCLLPGIGGTLTASSVEAATSVVGQQIDVSATSTCIGIKWFIDGDDNLNATVEARYRSAGGTDTWHPAQPLLRVEPGSFNGDGVDPGNLLAGSFFGLIPDTDYEIELTLSDPDGGFASQTRNQRTRAVPGDPVQPRVRYVVPGSGGGSGTATDPFRGLAAANSQAEPGDLFLIQPGTYVGVSTLSASGTESDPIVWRGTDPDSVVLDGEDTAKPVVDFPGSRYVHLESVSVIRPRQMAIRGTATSGVVVRGCLIDSSNLTGSEKGGIYFFGPEQENAWIADNVIRGPIHWEDGRDSDAYALVVAGVGHVVQNNEIYDWYDGINVGHGESGVETSNCDVSGNEVYNCTDDGIETDGSRHNIRVWENRFTNVLCGISAQPVYGGPVYAIRNVVYNYQLKPLKFHVWPTGLIVLGNTFVGADPRGWGDGQWRNVILRNNLFIGGSQQGHSGDPIAFDTTGELADFDYNGWYQAIPGRFGRLNGNSYPTLAEFQSATDMSWHATNVDIAVFQGAEEPELGPYLGVGGYLPGYVPGSQDLRLVTGVPAEDAGVALANINDGWQGMAPDLGAYELGVPVRHYGPGTGDPSDVSVSAPGLASMPSLVASPNPFVSTSRITFRAATTPVSLRVYSAGGRLVRTLISGMAVSSAGTGAAFWDGTDDLGRQVGSGLYFLRLESADRDRTLALGKVLRVN